MPTKTRQGSRSATRKARLKTAKKTREPRGCGPSAVRSVRAIMARRLVTVDARERLGIARSYMRLSGIRHLVVLRQGKLAGVVSERDILSVAANHGVSKAWDMRAEEVMSTRLLTVAPDDPVEAAARKMAENRVGCLPVVSDGEIVGIVTTTDVLRDRAIGETVPIAEATAAEVMSPDPAVVSLEESVYAAARKMSDLGIRHLPVVDADGLLAGVVSDRDVRAAIGDPKDALVRWDEDEDVVRVAEFMAPNPVTASPETPVPDLAAMLGDERVGAVVVVDAKGVPVGVVSYVDLLARIARGTA